jgi:hypothetical protein
VACVVSWDAAGDACLVGSVRVDAGMVGLEVCCSVLESCRSFDGTLVTRTLMLWGVWSIEAVRAWLWRGESRGLPTGDALTLALRVV